MNSFFVSKIENIYLRQAKIIIKMKIANAKESLLIVNHMTVSQGKCEFTINDSYSIFLDLALSIPDI